MHAAVSRPRRPILALLLAAAFAGPACADEPLPLPDAYSVCSPSGAFCARLTPEPPEIAVHPADRPDAVLWSAPRYARTAHVADDGRHAVLGWDGLNLVPWPPRMGMTMLTFLRDGEVIREVPLRAIIGRAALTRQRTVSHAVWGYAPGIDAAGRLEVRPSEGEALYFDVTTGRRVSP
jgi:hypothetical protein